MTRFVRKILASGENTIIRRKHELLPGAKYFSYDVNQNKWVNYFQTPEQFEIYSRKEIFLRNFKSTSKEELTKEGILDMRNLFIKIIWKIARDVEYGTFAISHRSGTTLPSDNPARRTKGFSSYVELALVYSDLDKFEDLSPITGKFDPLDVNTIFNFSESEWKELSDFMKTSDVVEG